MENSTEKITAEELKKILGCKSLTNQDLDLVSGGLSKRNCATSCYQEFTDEAMLIKCLQRCISDIS